MNTAQSLRRAMLPHWALATCQMSIFILLQQLACYQISYFVAAALRRRFLDACSLDVDVDIPPTRPGNVFGRGYMETSEMCSLQNKKVTILNDVIIDHFFSEQEQ